MYPFAYRCDLHIGFLARETALVNENGCLRPGWLRFPNEINKILGRESELCLSLLKLGIENRRLGPRDEPGVNPYP